MAMVQSAFFANFVTFPSRFGGRFCREQELLDLIYFWRVVGYYLGIPDKYVMCIVT